MLALLQRVTEAEVAVAYTTIAQIGSGLLVLVGIERGDGEPQGERLLERLLGYRVFSDDQGQMNRSLIDIGGDLLLVPQFTLAADTRKGTRPSFTLAAPPRLGEQLFNTLVARAKQQHPKTVTGRFGTHMQVTLTNDGPVTFMLRVPPPH